MTFVLNIYVDDGTVIFTRADVETLEEAYQALDVIGDNWAKLTNMVAKDLNGYPHLIPLSRIVRLSVAPERNF